MTLSELHALELAHPNLRPVVVLLIALLVAGVLHLIVGRLFAAIAARTSSSLDDQIIAALRPALVQSAMLVGVWLASEPFLTLPLARSVSAGILASMAVLRWALCANAVADGLLDSLTNRATQNGILQPRTLPLFRIGTHILVWGGAVYVGMLAWGIDVRAWLASAGIVGIAFGFAAKDTLANLFAGVFIIADRPYRVGDFLTLDTGERGRVTEIGFRSTRIVTLDDIEVVVPNALMANVRVINESGGPRLHMRVRNFVTVGFGVDLDRVQALLLEVASGCLLIAKEDPAICPRVRVRALGPNGIELDLQVWVLDPELREPAAHEVLGAVYRRLQAEGIPLSYAKHDLHVRELPAAQFGAD